VAVEKLEISGISGNFGDRKCLAQQEKVVCIVGHPDAMFFCGFLPCEFFNSHRPLHSKPGTKAHRTPFLELLG
jgi:hypothetical protein